jgi:hypothetical protein
MAMAKYKVRITPHYVPLTQQKYCCLPCCIQWILLRRGMKLLSQDEMARDLGVVIAPEDQRLFNIKMKVTKKLPRGKLGYGTWSYTIPNFLKKHKIPLTVRRHYPSKLDDVKKFLCEHLKTGNDIIVSYNVAAYAKPGSGVKYVHSCIVDSVTSNKKDVIVTLGDPAYSHRKFFDIELQKLLNGMTNYGEEKNFKVFTKYPKTL